VLFLEGSTKDAAGKSVQIMYGDPLCLEAVKEDPVHGVLKFHGERLNSGYLAKLVCKTDQMNFLWCNRIKNTNLDFHSVTLITEILWQITEIKSESRVDCL